MHRGRTWTQRQLIGLGTPEDYNERVRVILDAGATAISLLPCNSGFRGVDCDEVDPVLLGTCGTVVNTTDHMDRALDGVPLGAHLDRDERPLAVHAACLHCSRVAKRRGIPWSVDLRDLEPERLHFAFHRQPHVLPAVAARLAARAARSHRVLPQQRAELESGFGGRPAYAAGRRDAGRDHGLHALDRAAICAGLRRARHGHRSSCYAASLSSSTFRSASSRRSPSSAPAAASGRGWRASGSAPRIRRSWRFKFHGQTSGVDLTEQQPLNNIARVAVQAMAGIMSGLQSLHTDAYDEAITTPTEETARIAVATQNILREEAHLCDVIDPLGGSYYVETLTDQMEAEMLAVIAKIDAAGGMYKAAESRPRASHDRAVGAGLSGKGRKRRGEDRRRQLLSVDDDAGRLAQADRAARSRAHGASTSRASRRTRRNEARPTSRRALDALARAANSATRKHLRASGRGGRSRASRTARSSAACATNSALGIPLSSPDARHAAARRARFVDRLARGDAARCARCITLTETGGAAAPTASTGASCPLTGRAAVVGFTGAPGAGKSTLIDAYIAALRARGPHRRGRCRRSVEPDLRRRGAGRPRADAAACRRSRRLHPLDGLARPSGRPVREHPLASSTSWTPPAAMSSSSRPSARASRRSRSPRSPTSASW